MSVWGMTPAAYGNGRAQMRVHLIDARRVEDRGATIEGRYNGVRSGIRRSLAGPSGTFDANRPRGGRGCAGLRGG
ncbi:hypothetical protein FAIPA1_40175 [Frankia sp. AiPs1]